MAPFLCVSGISCALSQLKVNIPWHRLCRKTSKKGMLIGWWLRRCSSIWPNTICIWLERTARVTNELLATEWHDTCKPKCDIPIEVTLLKTTSKNIAASSNELGSQDDKGHKIIWITKQALSCTNYHPLCSFMSLNTTSGVNLIWFMKMFADD